MEDNVSYEMSMLKGNPVQSRSKQATWIMSVFRNEAFQVWTWVFHDQPHWFSQRQEGKKHQQAQQR